MTPVRPVSGPAPHVRVDPAVRKVAGELEAVFTREIVAACSKAAAPKESAYAGMITDALASAIASAGGLGMTRLIEEAVSKRIEASPRGVSAPIQVSEGAAVRGTR